MTPAYELTFTDNVGTSESCEGVCVVMFTLSGCPVDCYHCEETNTEDVAAVKTRSPLNSGK